MRQLQTTAMACMLFALLGAGTIQAQTTMKDVAVQNAWVEGDNSSVGIRARNNTFAGSGAFAFAEKSWIKFDLSGDNPDPDAPATFRVVFNELSGLGNNGQDFNLVTDVYGLSAPYTPNEVGELGTGWTEGTITWETAPENDSNSDFELESLATFLDDFDLAPGGTLVASGTGFEIDLPMLGDFLQPDGTVSLMITTATSRSSQGDSRRFFDRTAAAGNQPTLEFATLAVPEPTSIALWLIAGFVTLGMFARRRNKAG